MSGTAGTEQSQGQLELSCSASKPLCELMNTSQRVVLRMPHRCSTSRYVLLSAGVHAICVAVLPLIVIC